MRKKIGVIVSIVIIVVIIVIYIINSSLEQKTVSNNLSVSIGQYDFRYEYRERFSGNIWNLYSNNGIVCSFEPFEGFTNEEMIEHLTNVKLVDEIYNNKEICVYAFPLLQYEKKYKIVYTLDGYNFYCWNEDILKEGDENIRNRLLRLYENVSKETIENVSEYSWE